MIHYVPERYEPEVDHFGLLRALSPSSTQRGDFRTNWRAGRRYRAYRNAYEICLRDGLNELATA
jgi:hypothetical protein